MKMARLLLGSLLMLFLLLGVVSAVNLPAPQGFVNDFSGILQPQEKIELEAILQNFEKQTSNEIVVAIVKSLDGLDRFSYAQELFVQWGPGKKDKNNGILFLIALQEREAFINVGYGLEGGMPDGLTGSILRAEVFPQFKNGEYFAGIQNGVAAIMAATKGEYTAPPETGNDYLWLDRLFPWIFIFGWVLFQYFISFLARTKSWWAGGVFGGVGGLILGAIFFSIVGMLFFTVGLAASGLLLDYLLSRN